MKYFLFLLTILIVGNKSFSQGWIIQQSGVTDRLSKVAFANPNIGYVCGFGGVVLKTTNGGVNWNSLTSGTVSDLYSLTLIDSFNVWVCGAGGTIIKTTDGGATWLILNSGTTQTLRDIGSVVDYSSNIYLQACGDNGTVVVSVNGGSNWYPNNQTNTTVQLNSILLDQHQATSAIIAGAGGTLIYSTGGGFGPWPYPGSDELVSLKGWYVPTPTTLYLCASNGNLTKGVASWTWTQMNTGATGTLHALDLKGDRIWVVGNTGTICYSSDAGSNWQVQLINTYFSILSICMIDSITGWLVGDGGLIASTSNGGITEVTESELLPNKFLFKQNYPNPFNPSTKISWQSPIGSWQTLKVFDVSGREVATLVDEYRNAGNYEVEFNAESSIKHPASGIYFYQLKAGSFIETRKMLLIK